MKKLLLISTVLAVLSCNGKEPDVALPSSLEGTLVYEESSQSGSSAIIVADLSENKVVNISSTWKIGSPCHPAISPDGRWVVFQGRSGGKWHIYLYDITSGALPKCLSSGWESANHTDPSFSADGSGIVFVKDGNIASCDISGDNFKAMTFEAGANYEQPRLNSDASLLVYSSAASGKPQLGLLKPASGSSKDLFFNSGAANSSAVFCASDAVAFASRSGRSVIQYARSVTDTPATVVSEEGADCVDPFPYNSKFILLSCNSAGNYDICLASVGAAGKPCPLDSLVPGVNNSMDQRRPSYSPARVSIAEPEDGGAGQTQGGDVITSDTDMPTLKGKLVYHNYTSYDAMDSQMYIYDFAEGKLTTISRGWTTVRHPMNGHFSPDGRYICLMGIGTATDSWDVFLYDLEAGGQPVNLTPDGGYRDEDPKFSHDGTRICFKRNDHLAEIDVASRTLRILYKDNQEPYSMPYYTPDDTRLLVGAGAGSNGYIGLWDIQGKVMRKLYDRPGLCEYYPIGIDFESFYFTTSGGAGGNYDQLYRGYYTGAQAKYLAFNKADADYSDAYPVSEGWLFLVSTRRGGQGQYDLYIGNAESGAIYSLNKYYPSINTSKNELGPAYYVEK